MKTRMRIALTGGIVGLLAFAMPGTAAAQALTQTIQVLPPGGSGCPTLVIHAITAHVYDGSLHSFDVTVGSPTYVAVLAQVGGEGIPFRHMTRFAHGGGMLRHHVDLDTTPIRGSIPVSLTLLSSPAGSPTCLSVISFSVSSAGAILAPGVISGNTGGSSSTTGTGSSQATGSSQSSPKPAAPSVSGQGSATPTATSAPDVAGPAEGGVVSTFRNLCSGNGAFQLWFLLLALCIVLAALTALAKPPLAMRSTALPLALILIPLIFLLGFWYLAPSCRAAGWVPAVSIIVAIGALLVAFREQNPAVKIIPLPAAKPSAKAPAVVNKTDPKAEQGKKK